MKLYELLFETEFHVLDDGTAIYINPTKSEFWGLLGKSSEKELRGFIDDKTGDVFVWDAYRATHDEVTRETGLEGTAVFFGEKPEAWVMEYSPLIRKWYIQIVDVMKARQS